MTCWDFCCSNSSVNKVFVLGVTLLFLNICVTGFSGALLVVGNQLEINKYWKIEGNKLVNKDDRWNPEEEWNFGKGRGGLKRIENKNKKVLEIPEKNKEGIVAEESYDKNKEEQLWKKGKSDDNDYFTLKNKKSSEFLAADSENSFKVKDPMSTLDLGSDVKIKGTIWASSFIAHGVLGALISALLVTGTGCFPSNTLINIWIALTCVKSFFDVIVMTSLVYGLYSFHAENIVLTYLAGTDLFFVILAFILGIWAIFAARKAQDEMHTGFEFDGSIAKRASRAFRNSVMFK